VPPTKEGLNSLEVNLQQICKREGVPNKIRKLFPILGMVGLFSGVALAVDSQGAVVRGVCESSRLKTFRTSLRH
jgi:hypothetical protein